MKSHVKSYPVAVISRCIKICFVCLSGKATFLHFDVNTKVRAKSVLRFELIDEYDKRMVNVLE